MKTMTPRMIEGPGIPLSFAATCLHGAAIRKTDPIRRTLLVMASQALSQAGEETLARRVRASIHTPADWDLWDAVCERLVTLQSGNRP